jgi:xanthine dehydrogenase molybdopterin-binding subunit B
MRAVKFGVGQSVVRKEDDPPLRGRGRISAILRGAGRCSHALSAVLAGQVHGGTVQGIGQALLERAVYDPESGQLVTASLMDYAVPRADEVPAIVFETFVAGITRWA